MPGVLPKLIVVKGCGTNQTRIAQACDRCRSKKIRCDGHRPTCSQCASVGFECKTSDKLSRRAFPRGYTESLEERVRALEREVRELKDLIDIKDEQLEMLSRLQSFSSYSPPSSIISSSASHTKAGSPSSHGATSPIANSSESSPMMTNHGLHQGSPTHAPDIDHMLQSQAPPHRDSVPGDVDLRPSASKQNLFNDFNHPGAPDMGMPNLQRARTVQHTQEALAQQHIQKASLPMRANSVSYDHNPTMQQQWRQEAAAARRVAPPNAAAPPANSNADGTSNEEWERMLAIIDASHAAHIYGTAGGSIVQPTLRDFDSLGPGFDQAQRNQQRNAFASEMMPPPPPLMQHQARSAPALVDGPWNM